MGRYLHERGQLGEKDRAQGRAADRHGGGRLTFEHEYTPEQAEQSEADERTTSDKIAQCVAAIHTLREEIDKLSAECEKDA